jgi:hypothetical protein
MQEERLKSNGIAAHSSHNGVRACHCSNIDPPSIPIPHSVEVEVNLRPTFSRPVCPGVRRPSGTFDQFFFRQEIFCRQLRLCCFVAPSLTRGRVCNLLFNCFWAMPEQSLLSRSPAELTAIFYCRTSATTPIGFLNPTQHKAPMRVNICTP